MFIAHTKIQKDNKIAKEKLRDHLINCRRYSEEYGTELGLSHITGIAALVHDLGKYRSSFQEYLENAIKNPDQSVRGSVDHSTFGGMFIRSQLKEFKLADDQQILLKLLCEILENSIFSHHNTNGLKDYLDVRGEMPFLKRISRFEEDKDKQKELNQISNIFFEEVISKKKFLDYLGIALHEFTNFYSKIESEKAEEQFKTIYFLAQFIYSCVLDADRTDTACFEFTMSPLKHDSQKIFKTYYQTLLNQVNKMNSGEMGRKTINQYRAKMSDDCDIFAEKKDGIYTLSMPTGGGKTLSSLRYALKHAVLKKQKRIIYVLPFITIIEQNANVLREKLNGDKKDSTNILEFHSNVSTDLKKHESEQIDLLDLSEENWDEPIIVTTMVQFLNAIYGSGTQNRRRFHNLCNSVIVFDEVQKVPIKCISMFNQAVNFLKDYGACSVVLCTATQPALSHLKNGLHIDEDHEIARGLQERVNQFKRVRFHDCTEKDGVANRLNVKDAAHMIFEQSEHSKSILGIFNTIDCVKNIYKETQSLIKKNSDIRIYYLSTQMCPSHRQETIKKINNDLCMHRKVICLSTPLIEAGVDVSFECVFRSLCGLDSIVQAAGRCNRNSEMKWGDVYIVLMADEVENISMLEDVNRGKKIVERYLRSGIDPNDFLTPEVVRKYFVDFLGDCQSKGQTEYLTTDYGRQVSLSQCTVGSEFIRNILQNGDDEIRSKLQETLQHSSSETIARHFEVIENNTTSVIVPYHYGKKIISELNGDINDTKEIYKLLKAAQPFMINVFESTFRKINDNNGVVAIRPDRFAASNKVIYALRENFYDDKNLGLVVEGNQKISECVF